MLWSIIKSFIKIFYYPIKLSLFKYKWKILNSHNKTYPIVNFPVDKVRVGNYSYGPLEVYTWNNHKEKLSIGSLCSIASGVKFLLGGNHELYNFSTFPFRYYFENKDEAMTKGIIDIGDDVWIGMDTIILSGVSIGRGCVIAAGSVITKSFPPYSIVGGNPAKIIKMRFDEETIMKLMLIDFSKINDDFIISNINYLYDKNKITYLLNKLSIK